MSLKGYKIFHLKRVPYGKKTTPIELREYTVMEFPTSVVGTINEIASFIKNKLPKYRKIALKASDIGGVIKFNWNIEE